jgi:hypothetical protein
VRHDMKPSAWLADNPAEIPQSFKMSQIEAAEVTDMVRCPGAGHRNDRKIHRSLDLRLKNKNIHDGNPWCEACDYDDGSKSQG